jgi:hypothetical protein
MPIRFDRVTIVFTVADIDRTETFYRNHFKGRAQSKIRHRIHEMQY